MKGGGRVSKAHSSRLPPRVRFALGRLQGLLLPALTLCVLLESCYSTPSPAPIPFDVEPVIQWCRQEVVHANRAASMAVTLAGRRLLEARRDIVESYVHAVAESIESFRRQISRTDSDLTYDTQPAREALLQAETSLWLMVDELVALGLGWIESLDRCAVYLDALDAGLSAVESGQPASDDRAFMLRYRSLIDVYGEWVEATRVQVERINRGVLDLLVDPTQGRPARHVRQMMFTTWPRLLSSTCCSGLEGAEGSSRLPRRRISLHERLIRRAQEAELLREMIHSQADREALGRVLGAYLEFSQAFASSASPRPSLSRVRHCCHLLDEAVRDINSSGALRHP